MSTAVDNGLRSRFVKAFRRRADTVCVVAYLDADRCPRGMTATAVCSVSVDPPMLVACINRDTPTFEAIAADGRFALNVLSAGQQQMASRCAIPGGDKTLAAHWLSRSPRPRLPRLSGAAAYVDCDVAAAHVHGTHALLVGLVHDVMFEPDRQPLLYFDGSFQELERLAGDPRPESWWIA